MCLRKPYSLKNPLGNSDQYYRIIAAFADRWLRAQDNLARIATSFQAYLTGRALAAGREDPERSSAEIAFELLALGVLLQEHGEQALRLPAAPAWMLSKLVETQDRLPTQVVERPVKVMRGLVRGLAGPAMRVGAGQATFGDRPMDEGPVSVLRRLIAWLRAEGQTAEADRLSEWRDYLACLNEQSAEAILARCLIMAEEFTIDSEAVLGVYTSQVNEFLTQARPEARWRYDSGLVLRTRVEYHLGMLGAEILSRAYHERFLAAQRKLVIVPDCLCARSKRAGSGRGTESNLRCHAEWTPLGSRCTACSPNCKVRTLSVLGQRHGFEVYILPDDLRGAGLITCQALRGLGVLGISCALTNWDTGWQADSAGVPTQGVLLDYAGCKTHWQEQGAVTDVNVRQVLERLGVKEKVN